MGALPATPIEYVPPDKGEKNPLVSVFRLVTDAIPAVPDEVETNSPPSGEMAIPRSEPVTASEVTPPDCPLFITCTPENVAAQIMELLTLIAARVSLPIVNEVVVSSTPFAFNNAIVHADAVEDAPAVPAGRL